MKPTIARFASSVKKHRRLLRISAFVFLISFCLTLALYQNYPPLRYLVDPRLATWTWSHPAANLSLELPIELDVEYSASIITTDQPVLEIYKFVEVASGEWVMTLETQKVPESTGPNEYAGDEADSSLSGLTTEEVKYFAKIFDITSYLDQTSGATDDNYRPLYFHHAETYLPAVSIKKLGLEIEVDLADSRKEYLSHLLNRLSIKNT